MKLYPEIISLGYDPQTLQPRIYLVKYVHAFRTFVKRHCYAPHFFCDNPWTQDDDTDHRGEDGNISPENFWHNSSHRFSHRIDRVRKGKIWVYVDKETIGEFYGKCPARRRKLYEKKEDSDDFSCVPEEKYEWIDDALKYYWNTCTQHDKDEGFCDGNFDQKEASEGEYEGLKYSHHNKECKSSEISLSKRIVLDSERRSDGEEWDRQQGSYP